LSAAGWISSAQKGHFINSRGMDPKSCWAGSYALGFRESLQGGQQSENRVLPGRPIDQR
jgi:hypothetical protein